ncbi:MAG TPA: hypothetical protein VJ813_11665 [Vicinamibacterales bacterium]|nr:hypothetical protein [Vicinamibacterales bacterium]
MDSLERCWQVSHVLVASAATPTADDPRDERVVVLRDDCDPSDPDRAPTGGCSLPDGDVNLAEFNSNLLSPLAPSVIGHLAWRFDPGYLKVAAGKKIGAD